MAITHQYHQNTMYEFANKGNFVTFTVKGILLGYMATNPAKENRTGDDNDSENNNGTLACATTKMKSNVVSMCIVPVKIKCNNSRKELETYTMLDCCSQGTFINSQLVKKLRTECTTRAIKIKKIKLERKPRD